MWISSGAGGVSGACDVMQITAVSHRHTAAFWLNLDNNNKKKTLASLVRITNTSLSVAIIKSLFIGGDKRMLSVHFAR